MGPGRARFACVFHCIFAAARLFLVLGFGFGRKANPDLGFVHEVSPELLAVVIVVDVSLEGFASVVFLIQGDDAFEAESGLGRASAAKPIAGLEVRGTNLIVGNL